ncbi:hypothetical protein ACW2Q0_18775 [Nocardia sp. R16R-3T]
MFKMIRLAIIASVLAALGVVLTVQSPTAQAASSPCDFTFAGPGVPYFASDAVLVGGYANCDPAPETFHVSLELMYKQTGGSWVRRAAATDSKIPNPRLNIATYAGRCEPGAWQGIATMWVTVNGVTVSTPKARPFRPSSRAERQDHDESATNPETALVLAPHAGRTPGPEPGTGVPAAAGVRRLDDPPLAGLAALAVDHTAPALHTLHPSW